MLTAVFANGSRFEVVAWQEDFESGAPGWTHYDGMGSPNNWHIYNNGDQHENVWWMGNPNLATGNNIGGYLNSQYLVLDTPARMIDATNATLTFSLRYKMEATAGAEAPYNGWDACNVRYSSNGGPWVPFSGTPAYNMTSSFAFGDEHGEGPNIPGWGGAQTTWVNASFDLSSQVGRNVRIRFAFASDPAYDTTSDRTMFGMMVDDISFGGYTNDGVNDGQMTWASMVSAGPDLWHIAVAADAPSPTHIMACQNASNTYEMNMMNYLESPSIVLPSSGDIKVDFMAKSDFTDNSAWPDQEYFGFWISPDNGITWNYMSNPYDDPELDDYVFTGAANQWTPWSEGWGYEGLISDFAGQTIKLRWVFRADDDAPIGAGFIIDDVKIYNDLFVAPPENLAGVVTGNSVALTWAAPGTGGGGEPGWLKYDNDVIQTSIGTGVNPSDFDVAAKWDPMGEHGISPWVGMNITKIQYYPMADTCTYAVRIWTGAASTLVVDQPHVPVIDQWNEVVLTTPWTIPSGTIVMAGYRCNEVRGFPASCDSGPAVDGYGNMMRFNNAWTTLSTLIPTSTFNWHIRVYVQDALGREYVLGQDLPNNTQIASGTLSAAAPITRDRDVTAYKVFRNDVLLAEVPGTQLTYTDTNVPGGVQNYTVTALFGTYESLASNVASVFVYPASYVELGYDDSTPELGFNVGPTKRMGVKFSYPHTVVVKNAKAYVHTVGSANMIFHLFDASGENGMPGVQLAQYQLPAASVVQGWNTITWPTDVTIANGTFYITILETANASAIGMDTATNGHSYKKITTAWEPITEGEVMIHAIFDTAVSNEDDVAPVIVLDANNYPNPFNPETTISFSLPTSGATSLQIFNLKGQLVRSLVNRDMAAGTQRVVWNGMDDNNNPVSSGLYFYQVNNAGKSITRKMLLAK